MKYLNKQQSAIPTLVDENNVEATCNSEKADMLNPLGSLGENTSNSTDQPSKVSGGEDLYCEVECVEGPDGISGKMLKCICKCIVHSLTVNGDSDQEDQQCQLCFQLFMNGFS